MDAETMAAELAAELEAEARIPVATRQRLLAALVRAYARGRAEGEDAAPFPGGALMPEEVAVTAAEMLRTSDITTFELAALFNV